MTEQRAVYRAFKTMGLRRRYKARGGRGGRFIYRALSPSLFFDWDGGAKSGDGSLVLVEAELSAPNALHMQGHLSRLAIMIALREPVAKMVWVVRRTDFRKYMGVVSSWVKCFQANLSIQFPPMEYRDPQGNLIASTTIPLK
jgi:hypothetical protein